MAIQAIIQNNGREIRITYLANRHNVTQIEFIQVVCNSVKRGQEDNFNSTYPSATTMPPERDAVLDKFVVAGRDGQLYHVDTDGNNPTPFYLNGGQGRRQTMMEDAFMVDSPFVGAVRFPPGVSQIKMDFVTLALCSEGRENFRGQYVGMVQWRYIETKNGDFTEDGRIEIIQTTDNPQAQNMNVPAPVSRAIIHFCQLTG
ncbi:MAG: hypothetical protein HC846_13405 [Blastocatellia bacterium]|nr:hypothetical protein [Blastocatellia bacterium]